MKVLIVADHVSYGGVAKTSQALHKCLLEAGICTERYAIHNLSHGWLGSVSSLWKAFRHLNKSRYDRAVLMHFEAIFAGLLCRFFSGKCGFVNTIHTDVDAYYCGASFLKKIILKAVFFALRDEMVVFDSAESELKAVRRFKFRKTKTIYNILVPPLVAPEAPFRGIGGKIFVFGSVARLHSGKNIDLLVRVFNSFWLDHPSTSLVLFGDGPELGRLKDYVATFPCASAIAFKGYVEKPDEIYSQFDALVGFSSMEGFGLVIIEALARRIPVLFSDCSCGPREILKPDSDPCWKTTDYEACDGGFLFGLPLSIKPYAPHLMESEQGVLEIFRLFYQNFDQLKNGDFVDLERFGVPVVGKKWVELLTR